MDKLQMAINHIKACVDAEERTMNVMRGSTEIQRHCKVMLELYEIILDALREKQAREKIKITKRKERV